MPQVVADGGDRATRVVRELHGHEHTHGYLSASMRHPIHRGLRRLGSDHRPAADERKRANERRLLPNQNGHHHGSHRLGRRAAARARRCR